ncbi:hypothetical protein ACN2WE_00040 [Streptomyces sp. cg28]|uniref:hypothetical protein n=1 Tax=Streptomyces sp. cg28 TaxID=3403457 RepID=UPI003B21A385
MAVVQGPPSVPPMPTGPPPPASGRRRRNLLVTGALGILLGAGIVGAIWAGMSAGGPSEPRTFTLTGTFQLVDGESVASDGTGGCEGAFGYDDIAEGTSVTVYGADGDVIATGQLGQSQGSAGTPCTFQISIDSVPEGENFYKVEVSHRGTVQLTAEEAQAGQLGATLG